eukprot:symbB.v1.2.017890.t1/scaffold1405.1/size120932/4
MKNRHLCANRTYHQKKTSPGPSGPAREPQGHPPAEDSSAASVPRRWHRHRPRRFHRPPPPSDERLVKTGAGYPGNQRCLVACRFKIWVQGYLSRHWLGRTRPAAVPCPPQVVLPTRSARGRSNWVAEIRRGTAAEAAVTAGVKVTDVHDGLSSSPHNFSELMVMALPNSFKDLKPSVRDLCAASYAEAVGSGAVNAVLAKHWGVGKALLEELHGAPEAIRQKALSKADSTRKTVLRMSVDGLGKDTNQLLQVQAQQTAMNMSEEILQKELVKSQSLQLCECLSGKALRKVTRDVLAQSPGLEDWCEKGSECSSPQRIVLCLVQQRG